MTSKLKLILITAVGTTLFWAGLLAVLLWCGGSKVDRIEAQFLAGEGGLGMFYGTNTKTQTVVLVVEELPMGTNGTGAIELLRRDVAPQQALRIGIRELAGKKQ